MTAMIGQQQPKLLLQRLVREGRVPHALMLLGPTGSGSLALGLWLSRYLQCAQNQVMDGPCEACNACRKSGQMIHPDIHYSYPTIGTGAVSTDFIKQWRSAALSNPYLDLNEWLQLIGAENKQGNINKDECNAIIKKLSLRAFEGKYKILVMWMPELLGKEGNRLLKLVEEPPEQTQFIFVAEGTEEILPTILSRCQLVKVDRLSDAEISDGLQAWRQIGLERARQLSFLADGDFRQALFLADNADNDDSAFMLDWLRRCWRGYGPDLMEWTDQFAKMGRENQKQFIQYCLHFLRELNLLAATGRDNLRLPENELNTARNMVKVLTVEKIAQLAELLSENEYYIERNANPKILFLDSSIRLHQIMKL